MEQNINGSITSLVASQIFGNNENSTHRREYILQALHIILNGDFVKYAFDGNIFSEEFAINMSSDNFQNVLSKLNEKQNRRKKDGVYYTPKDVTRYLIVNSFYCFANSNNIKIHNDAECIDNIENLSDDKIKKILISTIFDPTCGAGEFLVSALELKIDITEKQYMRLTDDKYINAINTIYGNDIELESIEISKIRLFFTLLPKIKNNKNLIKVAHILNSNLTVHDFVIMDKTNFGQYDIIIGNPPYVEYGKLANKPIHNYGNIYADVLHNSSLLLNRNGVMGFVIPISYVSTTRMRKIRMYLNERVSKQFILNYADRPDCLFSSVHQKLSLFIGCNIDQELEIFTSGYNYWYKAERKELLNGCVLTKSPYDRNDFIPKIGGAIELSIFNKIINLSNTSILDMQEREINENSCIYLNMRGCFWMKAFSFNPGSSEYKEFKFSKEIQPYILCLLNSSLFFMFWIIVSDCWHITSKELMLFKVVTKNVDVNIYTTLAQNLENKLERTKEYIGTKQIEYAYKHKDCKDEIDKIDASLQTIYNLTNEELTYIKNFGLKYRMGGSN